MFEKQENLKEVSERFRKLLIRPKNSKKFSVWPSINALAQFHVTQCKALTSFTSNTKLCVGGSERAWTLMGTSPL